LYGTLGATAAAAYLAKLDAERTRNALAIAAAQTSGVMRNFGTMTKSFHPAHAAHAAITATKLAGRGFGGDAAIIEGRDGYAETYGSSRNDLSAVIEGVAEVRADAAAGWRIVQRPPAIKAWPCCSGNHPMLTEFERLRTEGVLPEAVDIAAITIRGDEEPWTGALRFGIPATPLQAKFSLEYNVAAAVLDGRVDLSTFSADRFARGDIQAFAARVHRVQRAEARRAAQRQPHALPPHANREHAGADELIIELADGRRIRRLVAERRTLHGDEVVEKFRDNLAGSGFDSARIVAEVDALAERPTVHGLVQAVSRQG
jgi:2-methylcitrate dehydratase PrpD